MLNKERVLKVIRNVIFALCLCLASNTWADATHPGLIDHGNVFQPDTVAKVDLIAKQIQQTCHYDLVVEAFDSIPADHTPPPGPISDAFYTNWLIELAQHENVRGVFILIVRNPGHLQVGVGAVTGRKAFTGGNRIQLTDRLLTSFRAEQFDDGIIDAATFVEQTMMHNLGIIAPADMSTPAVPPAADQAEMAPTTVPTMSPATMPADMAMPATAPAEMAPPSTMPAMSDNTMSMPAPASMPAPDMMESPATRPFIQTGP